jgi:two-component system sensor histidine kinase HydH
MQTSPWIILGLTAILLIIVIVLAVQNTSREKNAMTRILLAKGAALIRAVEAGARTGMMGMMWGGRQIQRLLEETGRLPDVKYVAVVDEKGKVVAHSDPSKVDTLFRPNGQKLVHLGPDMQENWELRDLGKQGRVFEVHRHFRPHAPGQGGPSGRMQGMMRRRGLNSFSGEDWLAPPNREDLLIVAGLDVTPFEEAINADIRTTVVLSVILLLLGFGGIVSLFWMNSYRTAKRSLEDTSAFADEVVAHLPVGLIAFDPQGRITFFNAAASQITGLDAVAAKHRKTEAVLPAQLCGLKEILDKGKTITEKEMTCTFAGGRSVPVSVSATRIVNAVGALVGHILIIRDLGEVRRLQEEIHRQEKLAAIGGMAAGVAHEIRNPLSSIKGLASFFKEQFEEGSEAKEAAGVMINEVDRLNRVITELLDFSRPTELKLQVTDLSALVAHSIQLIHQDANNHGINIQTNIQDNLCQVSVDPDRLAQGLLNLYLNAIQAMPQGGTLNVQCRAEKDNHMRITVSDTGHGIAPEHIDKIFDPYFTTKSKGAGLGLAIVQKIVQAHHAHLSVESRQTKGTTFTLRLPCHQ